MWKTWRFKPTLSEAHWLLFRWRIVKEVVSHFSCLFNPKNLCLVILRIFDDIIVVSLALLFTDAVFSVSIIVEKFKVENKIRFWDVTWHLSFSHPLKQCSSQLRWSPLRDALSAVKSAAWGAGAFRNWKLYFSKISIQN